MSRISVRLDQDRKEQFKREAQSRGKSMSEVISEFVDEYINESDSGKLPDDDRLASCYKTIYDERAGYSVKCQDVIPLISDETNLSERNVKTLIERLDMRGYLTVSMGVIEPHVDIPTTTPEPVTPQDRRIDVGDIDDNSDGDPITDDVDDPVAANAGIESNSMDPVRSDGGETSKREDINENNNDLRPNQRTPRRAPSRD